LALAEFKGKNIQAAFKGKVAAAPEYSQYRSEKKISIEYKEAFTNE